MRKKIFITTCFALLWMLRASCQEPHVTYGRVKRLPNFESTFVSARNVDIWFPPGYRADNKYPVLYMHDGQMLFDSAKTWNKQEWKVDEVAGTLISKEKIRDCIVVGIWNSGDYRSADYVPFKPLDSIPANLRDSLLVEVKGKSLADNYLRFITLELKPYIDKVYPTLPDRDNTFIAGSSKGGLISVYAICEYPEIFGGAACLSTHWIASQKFLNEAIGKGYNDYLLKHLPDPAGHKIYFDYGTETLDVYYKPYQLMVDETMQAKGFTAKNWMTREFPGEDHSEKAWSKRLHIPLEFLLGK